MLKAKRDIQEVKQQCEHADVLQLMKHHVSESSMQQRILLITQPYCIKIIWIIFINTNRRLYLKSFLNY